MSRWLGKITEPTLFFFSPVVIKIKIINAIQLKIQIFLLKSQSVKIYYLRLKSTQKTFLFVMVKMLRSWHLKEEEERCWPKNEVKTQKKYSSFFRFFFRKKIVACVFWFPNDSIKVFLRTS